MDETYIMSLIDQLNQASHGERKGIIAKAAELLGKSEMTIYRWLKQKGWDSGRKTRADNGDTEVTDAELRTIAAIMRSTDRANKKKLLSVETAIEIAYANNQISRAYHPATIARLMRERGMSAKQLRRDTPHINLASDHPNHVWEIDPSFCVLYYIKDGKSLNVMDEAKFYKNKPHNFAKIAKDRVLRYVCVDHTTGAFYCRYYNTPGESAEVMFDFLMHAMGEKDKQHNPFEGVPKMLYWDKGSANQSSLITNLLEALDIEHHAHVKGNSRAKGSVEKHNDIVETNFEGRLAFTKITSIEQLNDACEAWQRHFQSTRIHTRHGMTRFDAWRRITAAQLVTRPPVELCRALMTSKPETRQVAGNYHIKYAIPGYGSHQYRVDAVDNVRIGETVTVTVNPFAAPSIWVSHPDQYGVMQRYEIAPLSKDQWGFTADAVSIDGHFQQAPLTETDRIRQDLDEMAYGSRDAQEVDKLRNSKSVPAFDGEIDALSYLKDTPETNVRNIPKVGTEREITETAPPRVSQNPLFVPAEQTREAINRPVLDLIKWAAEQIDMTPAINKALRAAAHPDGLPENQWQDALDQVLAAQAATTKPHLTVIA